MYTEEEAKEQAHQVCTYLLRNTVTQNYLQKKIMVNTQSHSRSHTHTHTQKQQSV